MNDFIHKESHTVEDQAFVDGANSVPKEHGLSEIQSQCDRRKAEVRGAAAPVIQRLDAHAKTFRALANAAQDHWEEVKQEHVTNIPRLILPLLLLAASGLAVVAEALLLASMLDMIGVADREWQLVCAIGIIVSAAILIHFFMLHREKHPGARWPITVPAGVIIGLTALGLLRAKEMAFSAVVSGSLLAQFLQAHVWLSRVVMVFLTLLFPVAATLVPHLSLEELHNWWHYRRARKRAQKLAKRVNHAESELDGANEKLEQELAGLDEQAKEWRAAHENFHALGAQVGAERPPRWTVWAKATAWAVVAFVLFAAVAAFVFRLLTPLVYLLAALAAAATWVFAAVHFQRCWLHPSAKEYRRMACLKFKEDDSLARGLEEPRSEALVSVPKPLPLESFVPKPAARGNGSGREVV